MAYEVNKKYPKSELDNISEWWQDNRQYDINEHEDYVEIVKRADELIVQDRILELKAELVKIKEDIEQEAFGLVRNDYADKKARAGEIINELRVLEGKEARILKTQPQTKDEEATASDETVEDV